MLQKILGDCSLLLLSCLYFYGSYLIFRACIPTLEKHYYKLREERLYVYSSEQFFSNLLRETKSALVKVSIGFVYLYIVAGYFFFVSIHPVDDGFKGLLLIPSVLYALFLLGATYFFPTPTNFLGLTSVDQPEEIPDF